MSVLSTGQKIYVSSKPFLVEKELGSGAFGTVYLVSDSSTYDTYALKAVRCKDPKSVALATREVQTLAKAKHERIVQILAADAQYLVNGAFVFLIVTEFCSGGDLNSRLNSYSTRDMNLKWICQISEALNYLHSLNPPIVHRDLKADNVLLTDPVIQDVKLGDFGLAREYLAMKGNDSSPQSAQMYYMTSGVGPMHWMAPEFFDQHYTEKADIFSLAGIFYAILTREYILSGSKKMYGVYLTYQQHGKVGLGYAMAQINPAAKVIFPSSFQGSTAMMRLIESMLNYNPHSRPTASEVNDCVENIRSSVQPGSVPSQLNTSCW